MPAPFTITQKKSRDNFTFEEYYKILEEVKQTYGTIDPTIRISPPEAYAADSQVAYGQPTKPTLISKFENLVLSDVGPVTREYISLLRGYLIQKYPSLSPVIQNISQEDTRIINEYLDIPEMQRYLTVNGYNSYVQYWQAYQDYRAITPKYPQRATPGNLEKNNPLVFGKRNANLFIPYVTTTVVPNATQVNRQTQQQQQQNLSQKQNTNIVSNITQSPK